MSIAFRHASRPPPAGLGEILMYTVCRSTSPATTRSSAGHVQDARVIGVAMTNLYGNQRRTLERELIIVQGHGSDYSLWNFAPGRAGPRHSRAWLRLRCICLIVPRVANNLGR